jgi:hypothetical protein
VFFKDPAGDYDLWFNEHDDAYQEQQRMSIRPMQPRLSALSFADFERKCILKTSR